MEGTPIRLHYPFRFEMEHPLARLGMAAEAVYGDFQRSALSDNSSEMIWMVRAAPGGACSIVALRLPVHPSRCANPLRSGPRPGPSRAAGLLSPVTACCTSDAPCDLGHGRANGSGPTARSGGTPCPPVRVRGAWLPPIGSLLPAAQGGQRAASSTCPSSCARVHPWLLRPSGRRAQPSSPGESRSSSADRSRTVPCVAGGSRCRCGARYAQRLRACPRDRS
jgi:hypothetical protein